jgi:signal peptidase I
MISARKQKNVKEIKSISLIIFFVLLFRSVFFEPFRIPSGSMIPTLMIGDFILVNKFAYGFKVPFSDIFSDPIYIGGPDKPRRGDVVVFKFPQDNDVNYIKRVIGLPGETIELRDKVVYVDGKPLDVEPIEGKEIMADMDDRFKIENLKFFHTETGHHDHVIQTDADKFYTKSYGPTVVPAGNYFVMGDNRDFSSDSRSWGTVRFNLIKGKAVLVWFSLIPGFGKDKFKFRPWRIFSKIF